MSCCFHLSFHVPPLCIKDTGLRKLICSSHLKPVRWVSAQCSRSFCLFNLCFRFWYRFAIVLEPCAANHLQASWRCICISSVSFFYCYRFLRRQRVGSVKVQAKLKCNARGFGNIPLGSGHRDYFQTLWDIRSGLRVGWGVIRSLALDSKDYILTLWDLLLHLHTYTMLSDLSRALSHRHDAKLPDLLLALAWGWGGVGCEKSFGSRRRSYL